MSVQAWQQSGFSEPQELQQNSSDAYVNISTFITNIMVNKAMPKAQILSYLVPSVSDSGSVKDANFYNMLMERTVSADSLMKDSIVREDKLRNISSHKNFKAKPRQNIFISLQKWEGIVTEVMDDAFLARLIDLTQKGADEEANSPPMKFLRKISP